MWSGSVNGWRAACGLVVLASLAVAAGCRATAVSPTEELAVRGAVERYVADRTEALAAAPEPVGAGARGTATSGWAREWSPRLRRTEVSRTPAPFFLGTVSDEDVAATTQAAESQPAREFVTPEGYWRRDIWHQMGHEAKDLVSHGFWKGFKSSFWDVENAAVLMATMGASIVIRESGVDDAVRRRTHGQYEMGDFDETVQLLGNPGTHFAAAGVLWLGSALTKDVKQHEVAKSLTNALAVNGVSTLILKFAANTRAPDDEPYAWPSGHTSSAFTVAAVLNEYYGPLAGIPSLALAGLVGYQRLDSRVHDFSDVVFGGVMGYIIGTSIARDEKAQLPELFGMKVVPFFDPPTGASGLALMKSW